MALRPADRTPEIEGPQLAQHDANEPVAASSERFGEGGELCGPAPASSAKTTWNCPLAPSAHLVRFSVDSTLG